MKKIVLFTSFIALAGCAGTDFNLSDIPKIKIGMEESEVIAIMGKPDANEIIGEHGERALVWSHLSTWDMTHKTYSVVIKDGKTITAPTFPVLGRGVTLDSQYYSER
jgi:hypothetical protein